MQIGLMRLRGVGKIEDRETNLLEHLEAMHLTFEAWSKMVQTIYSGTSYKSYKFLVETWV